MRSSLRLIVRNCLEDKNTLVRDLATQFVSLKRLLSRNELTEHEPCHQKKIYLPFVIVNTDMDNSVVCEISQDEKFAEINCTKLP
mmetsp:Transcript_36299/g.113253  ORF Transcript_36299/g.113253 Transcript_36299/m.113253 type:complete len:85 (+) Transcript_36299:101-355(+)